MKQDNSNPVFNDAPFVSDDGSASIVDWLSELNPAISHCLRPSQQIVSPNRQEAKAKRESEFKLGRLCAESQLALLGESHYVGVNPDRSPDWPIGFTGSISHSDRWTWAAVAKTTKLLSVGIDTEAIVSESVKGEIEHEILTPGELETIRRTKLNSSVAFTVAFSAKESIYKCCYPLVQRFFGFDQASVETAEHDNLGIQLNPSNPAFACLPDKLLKVYFQTNSQDVFTLTWLETRNEA